MVLRDALVSLLGLIGGPPTNEAQTIALGSISIEVQPVVVALRVEIPPMSVAL